MKPRLWFFIRSALSPLKLEIVFDKQSKTITNSKVEKFCNLFSFQKRNSSDD